jgi:acyl carrier protein
MEYNEVFGSVRDIMRKVFDNGRLEINDATSAGSINRWDSLNHVILISEIEKKFGIRFDLTDMLAIRTVGDICQAVLRLTDKK